MTTRPAPEWLTARAPGTPVFRTGDIVAFRFRIVRYLAKGGMGELYEAEDLELRERIALKTILSHIAADERSILLFKREVHLARQVTHANVCRIYDVFRHRYALRLTNRPARSWFSQWSCCTARRWPTSSGGTDGSPRRRSCLSFVRWPPA